MKKIILLTILVFAFLVIAQSCLAVDLLLNWPSIGGESLGEQSSFPDLIKYIYTFALGICGIVALVSIVFGAAQYALSAGDSSKAGDAKDRITQALLGIVILLFAYLILYTINPDLVNLKL
jgi:dolichyl-phosphate-mannose--protein O-mannosyl transferase